MIEDLFLKTDNEPPEKPRIRHSLLADFLHCRMRYYWAWVCRLEPKKTSVPLQVGDIVHKLFHILFTDPKRFDEIISHFEEWVWSAYPNNDKEEALFVAKQAAGLVGGYLVHYQDDPLKQTSSEFYLEKDFGLYILWARIDGLVRSIDQRLWRFERKTTSYLDSAFLDGLRNSLQTGIYHILCLDLLPEKISGTYFDLLVKTDIPQYKRNPTHVDYKVIERTFKTIEGAVRDIKNGDFYPSGNCFFYNKQCEYIHLCNFDSPDVRQNFYQPITDDGGENNAG